jgi:hypothetical protein
MTELCNLGAAPSWVGEPSVIVTAATIGGWAWVLLAMPVLAAGLVQLRAWRAACMSRAGAWAGAWAAGLALMFLAAEWPPEPPVCGSATGYYTASVAWVELPACIAFLALGAVMTRILARPPQQLNDKIAPLVQPPTCSLSTQIMKFECLIVVTGAGGTSGTAGRLTVQP